MVDVKQFRFNPKENNQDICNKVRDYLDNLKNDLRKEYKKGEDKTLNSFTDCENTVEKILHYSNSEFNFYNSQNIKGYYSLREIVFHKNKKDSIKRITHITRDRYGVNTIIEKEKLYIFMNNPKELVNINNVLFELEYSEVPFILNISGMMEDFKENDLEIFKRIFLKVKDKMEKIEVDIYDKEINKKLLELF